MASGHPDWQTWAGRSVGGEGIITYSFSGDIATGITGAIDVPVVSAGQQNIYQSITISCDDDTAIHNLKLVRVSDGWIFLHVNFVTGDIYDFPGQTILAGDQVQLQVTNNGADTYTFSGTINWTFRNV